MTFFQSSGIMFRKEIVVKSVVLEIRETLGKGPARRARTAEKIPCSVYGLKQEPVACLVTEKNFAQIQGADLYNVPFEIKMGDQSSTVVCRDVQWDPVTNKPLHIDFLRVQEGAPVVARVPVEFVGMDKCPGLRQKGTLNVMLRFVRLWAKSIDHMPKKAFVDISETEAGTTLNSDIFVLPEGVELRDADKTVAKIIPPRIKAS
ncbi:MAG: 50S ribosomal protein L25 [Alphaproteobacteria bacterium]|nr:50S ribosomal protein L25 [Alphaproteobacteria bacterium]